jgi:Uma2 family endonuclease
MGTLTAAMTLQLASSEALLKGFSNTGVMTVAALFPVAADMYATGAIRRYTVSIKTRATIADLYKVEGKAELVNGEIVSMPPSGEDPGIAGGEIFVSLREYARRTQQGRAFPAGVGFHVNLPHREALGPDAAYHIAPRQGMRFAEGAPVFAVEVRSESDYGPAAERAMAAQRADYFACGTLVVWDVDLLSEDVIKS